MQKPQLRLRLDACMRQDRMGVSEHTYQYSMGFGDAWFLLRWMAPEKWGSIDPTKCHEFGNKWIGGTRYNHGMDAPHYPVPALLVDSMSDLGTRWSNWVDDMAMNGKRV